MSRNEELYVLVDEIWEKTLKIYNYEDELRDEEIRDILQTKDWVEFIEKLARIKATIKPSKSTT